MQFYCVCDEHKEYIELFGDNVSNTYMRLHRFDGQIQQWLQKHYECKLRLIPESGLEELWENNYLNGIKRA
jgi:hypothetical protein